MHVVPAPVRTRRWLSALIWAVAVAWALLATLALATATASPAAAQSDECAPAPPPGGGSTPPTGTTTPSTTTTTLEPDNKEAPSNCGPTGDLFPAEARMCRDSLTGSKFPCPADYNLDIGYDPGAWNNISRKVLGISTDIVFAILKTVIRFAIWIVTTALSFEFADKLGDAASRIYGTYQGFIDRHGLKPFFLMLAAAVGGWHLLRGRTAKGVGEFAVSCVILVVAVASWANPNDFLRKGLSCTADLSTQILKLTKAGGSTAGGSGGTCPPLGNDSMKEFSTSITDSLHESFIEHPHQLINWGEVLGPTPEQPSGHACWGKYKAITEDGPWGTKDDPRERMDGDCKALSDFNHDPTAQRLGAAVLSLIAAILVVLLMIFMAGTILASQLVIVALIALFPFAVLAGLLPGTGRQPLYRWISGAAKALVAILLTALFLSLFFAAVDASQALTDQSLIFRMAFINFLVIMAFMARKRMLRAGSRASDNIAKRMEQSRVGGLTEAQFRMTLGAMGNPTESTSAGVGEAWRESRRDLSSARHAISTMNHYRHRIGRSAPVAWAMNKAFGAGPSHGGARVGGGGGGGSITVTTSAGAAADAGADGAEAGALSAAQATTAAASNLGAAAGAQSDAASRLSAAANAFASVNAATLAGQGNAAALSALAAAASQAHASGSGFGGTAGADARATAMAGAMAGGGGGPVFVGADAGASASAGSSGPPAGGGGGQGRRQSSASSSAAGASASVRIDLPSGYGGGRGTNGGSGARPARPMPPVTPTIDAPPASSGGGGGGGGGEGRPDDRRRPRRQRRDRSENDGSARDDEWFFWNDPDRVQDGGGNGNGRRRGGNRLHDDSGGSDESPLDLHNDGPSWGDLDDSDGG